MIEAILAVVVYPFEILTTWCDGFGPWDTVIVWIKARRFGPTYDGKPLPDGSFHTALVGIQAKTDSKSTRLEAIWLAIRPEICAAMTMIAIAIEDSDQKLKYLSQVFSAHLASYIKEHRDLPPATLRPNRFKRFRFVCQSVLLALGELPLMIACMDSLRILPWEQFVTAVVAAAVTIILAHDIGCLFAKRGKKLGESFVAVILAITLFAALTEAALIRSDFMRDHKNTSPATMQVSFEEKTIIPVGQNHFDIFFLALAYGFALITIWSAYSSTDYDLEAIIAAQKEFDRELRKGRMLRAEQAKLGALYEKKRAPIRGRAIRVQRQSLILMTLFAGTASHHSPHGRIEMNLPESILPNSLAPERSSPEEFLFTTEIQTDETCRFVVDGISQPDRAMPRQ